MKSELATAEVAKGGERQQAIGLPHIGERKSSGLGGGIVYSTANQLIFQIVVRVTWDQHVEGIISSGKKQTNQCLIGSACALRGCGVHQPQIEQSVQQSNAAHSGAAGLTKKFTACEALGLLGHFVI
jgi:hypothetical protein